MGKLIGGIIAVGIAFVIIMIMFPIVIIGPGERGVVFNNTSGIEDRILGEGTHWRTPLIESVTEISVRTQKTDVKAEAASKDLQTVSTAIVVNWHLDASKVNKVYQQVGDEEAVKDRIIIPAVNETVKAATAKLTAGDVLAKRSELKADLDKLLGDRLRKSSVILDDVSITDVNFSKEFNAAIEAKQVAEQQAQQAGFLKEKAKNTADAAIETAKGEAEANRLKQQSLTPELLQLRAIEKWKGNLPQVTGGATPFVNIK